MGSLRLGVGLSCLGLVLVTACTADPDATSEEAIEGEPAPLPNPPPRYAHSQPMPADAGPANAEGGLVVRCGGRTPYVCLREDGSFVCSEWPCIPDCSRIGCVGGEVCKPCEAGFRCVAPGDHC
ncbi:MAG: hypothetical protein KF819_28400 [Labilithrix sp.]|nr:hypothetical protein [Labilithrix sp.]